MFIEVLVGVNSGLRVLTLIKHERLECPVPAHIFEVVVMHIKTGHAFLDLGEVSARETKPDHVAVRAAFTEHNHRVLILLQPNHITQGGTDRSNRTAEAHREAVLRLPRSNLRERRECGVDFLDRDRVVLKLLRQKCKKLLCGLGRQRSKRLKIFGKRNAWRDLVTEPDGDYLRVFLNYHLIKREYPGLTILFHGKSFEVAAAFDNAGEGVHVDIGWVTLAGLHR